MKIKELKEQSRVIRAQYEGKYHVKWPADFKRQIVDLITAGESIVKICKTTGIAQQTVDSWMPNPKFKKKAKGKFQELVVSGDQRGALLLKWSGGLEVSGLSFSEFTELLEKGLL